MVDKISLAVGAVGGAIAYILGGFDQLLLTLLICTALDFITGIIGATMKHELNATKCGLGIGKKILMYCYVALANVLQNGLGINIPLREVTIMFYIVQEGISILENGGKFTKYPKKLRDVLEKLTEEENE